MRNRFSFLRVLNEKSAIRNYKSAILVVPLLLVLCFSAEAQQRRKIPRIGYVAGFGDAKDPGPQLEGFRQGLRELGYVDGKNIIVEYRYLEGKRRSEEHTSELQ